MGLNIHFRLQAFAQFLKKGRLPRGLPVRTTGISPFEPEHATQEAAASWC